MATPRRQRPPAARRLSTIEMVSVTSGGISALAAIIAASAAFRLSESHAKTRVVDTLVESCMRVAPAYVKLNSVKRDIDAFRLARIEETPEVRRSMISRTNDAAVEFESAIFLLDTILNQDNVGIAQMERAKAAAEAARASLVSYAAKNPGGSTAASVDKSLSELGYVAGWAQGYCRSRLSNLATGREYAR